MIGVIGSSCSGIDTFYTKVSEKNCPKDITLLDITLLEIVSALSKIVRVANVFQTF